MSWHKRVIGALLGLSMATATPARAEHGVAELRCPEDIQYRIARDMNGDGIPDLLVVARKEVWLWYGKRSGLKAEPDARIPVPHDAALFHVGRLGQAPGEQLVMRTAKGYVQLLPGIAPKLLAPTGPGLPLTCANLLWRSLFTDLDRDGKPDFVDVSLKGYRIDYGDRGSVLLPPRLIEKADTSGEDASDRLFARIGFAEWHAGNFNGDLRPDFALSTPKGLLVYTGDQKGRFDPARTLTIEFDEAKDAELTLRDLNGDGQTDVIAVDLDSGTATILVADPRRGLAHARRVRLNVPGEMRNFVVSDFNGDGRPDLALPYVPKLGFQDILRVIARREVLIKVPLFLNKSGQGADAAARVFGALADNQLSLPVRVRVKTDSIGRILLGGLVVVEYEGDLDGNGRPDLLVTDTSTRLAVHPGTAGRVYREEPESHIEVPDCAEYESVASTALDLNGDGSSDIILHYRGAGRRPDRLFLLLSGKK